MESRVYLVFHFNLLAAIERSYFLEPDIFLCNWLKDKGMLHLVHEFKVGIWDKDSCSRGGIEIFEFSLSPALVYGVKCSSLSTHSIGSKKVFI